MDRKHCLTFVLSKYLEVADELKAKDKNKIETHDDNTNQKVKTLAEKHLFFLNGRSQSNQKYMNDSEYQRLISYTNYLFDKFELPENIEPIKSPYIMAGEIRCSFYLMLNERQPDKDYPEIVFNFICKVFPSLSKGTKGKNYKQTANYKKFKTKPQYWDSLIKR